MAVLDVFVAPNLILGVGDDVTYQLVQSRLIAFDREQIVPALGNDLRGNVPLAALSIDAHQQALQVQGLEQFRKRAQFVALAGDLLLPQHQAESGRVRADHMHGWRIPIGRPAHRLAIDRHVAIERADDATDPASERRLELFGIQHAEDPKEGVLRRDTILQNQKAPQPIRLEPTPQGDVLETVRVREHRAHRNHQDLPEVMASPIARPARVFQLTQCLHQARSRRTHFVRPKDESRRGSERVHKMAA